MKPRTARRARPAAVGCDLLGCASLRVSAAALPALRRSPGSLGGAPFPPSLLRHADGQTVVALAAVLRAVEVSGLDPSGFGGWSVVAAPRHLGRAAFDAAFPLYQAEGAWGVSPHLISSHSLHAVSGAVSQALGAHGPNLGAGGTPGSEDEALLAAAVLLGGGGGAPSAGAWVVLSGWDDALDGAGRPDLPAACSALALALRASVSTSLWSGHRLLIRPGSVVVVAPPGGQTDADGARPAIEAWIDPAAGPVGATTWRFEGAHPPDAARRTEPGRATRLAPAGERS